MAVAKKCAPDTDAEVRLLRAELDRKESEIAELRAEVDRLRGKALNLEDSRRAMLYMLEDLNETSASIERAKKEWETTFDSISDPIFIHDRECRILRANKAYMRASGLSPHEIIGRPYFSIFPKMEGPLSSSLKVLNGEMMEAEEELGLLAERAYKVRTYSVMSKENNYLYSINVLEDITESREAAIEKAKLYEKIREEAEVSASLLVIAETLNTTLEERELIKVVMGLVPRYMKFDRVGVFFYDEDLRGFTFSGGYGYSPVEEGMLLSGHYKEADVPAIAGLLRGETVIVKDASEKVQFSGGIVDSFHIGSAVMVPISFRGKVTGGIYADYRSVKEVEQKDVSLLKGLADSMAIALQNSRLYRESVERSMELSGKMETISTMSELDREILSTINRTDILRIATALVNRIIPCERAAVTLKEGDECRVVSEWGAGKFEGKVYSVRDCNCGAAERSHSSLFLPDISSCDCAYYADLAAIGIKSALVVPLVAKSEIIGFLEVGSLRSGMLTPIHLANAENIASQITVALENARLYEDLNQLLISTIKSLSSVIDAKSPWTKGHSERVTRYAVMIARELGQSEREIGHLELAGLLHDIGKIGTYDVVLDKPGRLTADEFAVIRKHPAKGAEILSPIKQLSDVIGGVRHHHERFDGKGYPDGLKGEDIPIQARILCVADSFDSMTADRPYRPAPGKEYAVSEFKRCSGTQFDPKVVEAFLKILVRSGD